MWISKVQSFEPTRKLNDIANGKFDFILVIQDNLPIFQFENILMMNMLTDLVLAMQLSWWRRVTLLIFISGWWMRIYAAHLFCYLCLNIFLTELLINIPIRCIMIQDNLSRMIKANKYSLDKFDSNIDLIFYFWQ